MGRHRKTQRKHPRRISRSVALVTAGLIIPLTGSAVVYAATNGPPPPPRRPPGSDRNAVRRSAVGPASPARSPAGGAAASSSPLARTPDSAASKPPQPSQTVIGFAPYADALAWPTLDLAKSKAKAFTMGFVTASDGCSASWDGLDPVDTALAVHRVKDVPGKVVLAFGGPRGTELAQSCDRVDDLVAAYRKAIDVTGPAAIDFYLTEDALADTASVQRRTEAIARIQQDDDRPLSITLPVYQSGLSAAALGALRSANTRGLKVSIINLVPADGVEQSLMSAATTAHGQLMRLYHQGDAQVWQRMGITPVVGVDLLGLPFRTTDARQLAAWAASHDLGRLSMWSLSRDTPCTGDTSVGTDTCSGLDEDTGAFSRVLQGL